MRSVAVLAGIVLFRPVLPQTGFLVLLKFVSLAVGI